MATDTQTVAAPPGESDIRFLHLLTTQRGGAGRAGWRLHEGLLAAGHPSRALVLEMPRRDAAAVLAQEGGLGFAIRRFATKAWLKLSTLQDYGVSDECLSSGIGARTMEAVIAYRPTVIVVHAISHFLSPDDVLVLQKATGAAVVWHLLDMASFTGGCHFAWDCRRYEATCGECPALRFSYANDFSARAWRAKARAMGQMKGVVVAGSSRLAGQARASGLFRDWRIEMVPLGLTPEEFGTRPSEVERDHFDIPHDRTVVIFGVQNFFERRKGIPLLFEALRQLKDMLPPDGPAPYLLIAGKNAGAPDFNSLGFDYKYIGYVGAEALARAYAAADIFVCPSIEDSGPMMVNEALMSGTPVVAFRMGVVPDLVKPGLSGEIAELGDAKSLAQCLARTIAWSPERRARARVLCREIAMAESASAVQVARFVAIAASLIA